MKLNKKGLELYDKWFKNYCLENDKLGGNSAESDFIEGWCIIDNDEYIKTLEDVCGLHIFGYDNPFDILDEWIEDWGGANDSIYGYTFREIKAELLKYYEV